MEIIFEDKNYIVVNKEAGLVIHSDGRTEEESLVSWLEENHPELRSVGGMFEIQKGEPIPRHGIVHRIDRETSGVLVIAKNHDAFESLQKQFQEHTVKKIYHAFVYGSVKEDEGKIDRPIGRSSTDFRKWSAQRGARGTLREALTLYRVMERIKDATMIEVEPKTGRTHQIRVHFKAINHPIVADKLYGEGFKPILGFKRLALHARSIEFKDLKGKRVSFEAPYPDDFLDAMSKL